MYKIPPGGGGGVYSQLKAYTLSQSFCCGAEKNRLNEMVLTYDVTSFYITPTLVTLWHTSVSDNVKMYKYLVCKI